jgi:hypothetical protein
VCLGDQHLAGLAVEHPQERSREKSRVDERSTDGGVTVEGRKPVPAFSAHEPAESRDAVLTEAKVDVGTAASVRSERRAAADNRFARRRVQHTG